ncbi:MAG: hydrolase [Betaproteobacteria bacterium]|nr:hydrolase [Betaproteobacteria bacterium]
MSNAKHELLTPANNVLVLIDYQPQMLFGVMSIDRQLLKNNAVALAKSATAFKVPTVLTSVETESFSGYIFPELIDVLSKNKIFERSSMNTWDDQRIKAEVKRLGRPKIVFAGLWTEVCITMPVLEALKDGYEVYFVEDASGGTSQSAHGMAVQRMIQAGAVPITWQQYLLELQRDWSRKDTYNDTLAIVKEHSGGYGSGVEYAYTMVHKQPQSRKSA